MKRTARTPITPAAPTERQSPVPEHTPPGMMDLEAARYWAGRSPRNRKRNRPAYSLKAMD